MLVFVNPDTRDIKVFLRRIAGAALYDKASSEPLFDLDEGGRVVDRETGSVWDTTRGVATEGPLKGKLLQQIPYVSSFDWAWRDFFPHTRFYGE